MRLLLWLLLRPLLAPGGQCGQLHEAQRREQLSKVARAHESTQAQCGFDAGIVEPGACVVGAAAPLRLNEQPGAPGRLVLGPEMEDQPLSGVALDRVGRLQAQAERSQCGVGLVVVVVGIVIGRVFVGEIELSAGEQSRRLDQFFSLLLTEQPFR